MKSELDLSDGAKTVERHTNRRADDASLGKRGVHDPIFAELFLQAGGGAKDPAEVSHVLAENYDVRVLAHLDAQGVVDRLDDVVYGHVEEDSSEGGA